MTPELCLMTLLVAVLAYCCADVDLNQKRTNAIERFTSVEFPSNEAIAVESSDHGFCFYRVQEGQVRKHGQ